MRTVALDGVETSVLGLGCADLFRETSRAARRRLLETALDAGIRHFDAAPMYGLGLVERELGAFARGRREQVVIATKFGIEPTLAGRLLGRVQGPLQPLAARRRAAGPAGSDPRAGRLGAALYRSRGYDGAAARSSLEQSLRRLGTGHVDLLLLHDPRPGDVRSDDVRACLEAARAEGLIRSWGVAGDPGTALPAVERLGGRVPVLQLRDDLLARRPAPEPGQATVVFGVLSRTLPLLLAHVGSDAATRERWSDALGVDCGRAGTLAPLLLREAADRSGGAVLFGTIRPDRIAAAAAAVEVGEPPLDRFRALVETELAAAGARQ